MRGHDTPTVGLRELDAEDISQNQTGSLCTHAWMDSEMVPIWLIYPISNVSLVHWSTHLEEESVTSLLLDGSLDSERVGDSQVVTNNLNLSRSVQSGPSFPVVLVEGVLDGDDVVLGNVSLVDLGELETGKGLGLVRVGVLSSAESLRLMDDLP